jgi:uncharacterized membrane protein YqhA
MIRDIVRNPPTPLRGAESTMTRVLAASRYLVVLAVAGCFIAATALFAYGLLAVVRVVIGTFAADLANLDRGRPQRHVVVAAEHLAVNLIQLADVFLLGTVIYLIGLGLHLLFVNPRLPTQPWIAVANLDDLKAMLVRVIILLVGVTFLGSFVEHADEVPVLELSAATALVVFAFTLVILVARIPDWSKAKAAREAQGADESTADGEGD